MKLHYLSPPPRWQSYLSMVAVVSEITQARVVGLPAMLPNVFIRLAGQLTIELPDASAYEVTTAAIVGPTQRAFRVGLEPGTRLLTLGILPAGWPVLVGAAADALSDEVVAAEGVWGCGCTDRLMARLHAPADHADPRDALDAALTEIALINGTSQPASAALLDHWLEHNPELSLDRLCAQLGISARQLRRITLARYGLTPKTLAMKYRALRLAARLSLFPGPASLLTFEGYADQSHAIRDFKRFIGHTPHGFCLPDCHNLARATLRGRLQAGAERPLVILS